MTEDPDEPRLDSDEAEPEPSRSDAARVLIFAAFCLSAILASAWIFRPGFRGLVYQSLAALGNETLTRWSIDGLEESRSTRALALIAIDEGLSYELRDQALRSLSRSSPVAEAAIPALFELYRRPEPAVALDAARRVPLLLKSVPGPAARYLAGVISGGGAVERRVQALMLLDLIDVKDPEVLPALLIALEDPDPTVRHQAINPVLDLGAKAAPALPKIFGLIDGPEARRGFGRILLVRLFGRARENGLCVPILEHCYEGADLELRRAALEVAELAPDATPLLLRGLDAPVEELRWRAALALSRREELSDQQRRAVAKVLRGAVDRGEEAWVKSCARALEAMEASPLRARRSRR